MRVIFGFALCDLAPCLSAQNLENSAPVYAKCFCNFCGRDLGADAQGADCPNILR